MHRRWRVGSTAASVAVAVALSGCSGAAAPEVADQVLACAAAFETRVLLARDELGDDPSTRAAAVLREVATVQFVLEPLAPAEPELAAGREQVVASADPVAAAQAVVELSETCERADLPLELDADQENTAACTQLRALDVATGDADADASLLRRLAFVLGYLERRLDDLDGELAEDVRQLRDELGPDGEVDEAAAERARAARAAAAGRCAELMGDTVAAPLDARGVRGGAA